MRMYDCYNLHCGPSQEEVGGVGWGPKLVRGPGAVQAAGGVGWFWTQHKEYLDAHYVKD